MTFYRYYPIAGCHTLRDFMAHWYLRVLRESIRTDEFFWCAAGASDNIVRIEC